MFDNLLSILADIKTTISLQFRSLYPLHKVPIVLAFDDKFAKYAAVTILSVLEHTRDRLQIICVSQSLSIEHRALLTRVAGQYSSRIRFIDLHSNCDTQWKVEHHFSVANYYRVFLPSCMHYERVLYLDSDIVSTCDISALLDFDMETAWLAGCEDPHGARTTRMAFAPESTYVNTGVLLMNLKLLRENDFQERCLQIHDDDYDFVTYADQCIINKACEHHIRLLDSKWNIQATSYERNQRFAVFSANSGHALLHFSGPRKPWLDIPGNAVGELWYAYAEKVNRSRAFFSVKPDQTQ